MIQVLYCRSTTASALDWSNPARNDGTSLVSKSRRLPAVTADIYRELLYRGLANASLCLQVLQSLDASFGMASCMSGSEAATIMNPSERRDTFQSVLALQLA